MLTLFLIYLYAAITSIILMGNAKIVIQIILHYLTRVKLVLSALVGSIIQTNK